MAKLGAWSLLIGLVAVAAISYFLVTRMQYIQFIGIVIALGLLVGFLNLNGDAEFLVVSVALLFALSFLASAVSSSIALIFDNLPVFVAASTLVVALKNLFSLNSVKS